MTEQPARPPRDGDRSAPRAPGPLAPPLSSAPTPGVWSRASTGSGTDRLPVPAQAPPATPPRAWTPPEAWPPPPPPPPPSLTGKRRGGRPPVVPEDFDRPSSARVSDYLLGGSIHGAVDREFARTLLRADPGLRPVVCNHRTFTRRVVRYLLAAGIEQFVDLGSGVPTMGAVHEVIAAQGSDARVAYVDVDPVAVAHGQHVLAGVPTATMSRIDIRDVDAVLDAPGVQEVVDLSRPVGLLAFSVLQHVDDLDDPVAIMNGYLSRAKPASALAVSHYASVRDTAAATLVEDEVEFLAQHFSRSAPRGRTAAATAEIVAGVDLVSPGVVLDGCWRPVPGRETRPQESRHWAAVGFRA